MENKVCALCGKKFKPHNYGKTKIQRWCSKKCATIEKNKKRFQWNLATKEQKFEHTRKNFEDRVVRQEGCWDWKGVIHPDGYGRIQCFERQKCKPAHKVSWILHKGSVLKGLCVLHKCDNRRCTNPDHLWLGTTQENTEDKVKKNRQAKGSKNGQAKLTEESASEIKKLLKLGVKGARLARDFGVSDTVISKIKKNEYWKHVNIEDDNAKTTI